MDEVMALSHTDLEPEALHERRRSWASLLNWKVYALLIVAVPGACAALWWFYSPEYQRRRDWDAAQQAFAAGQFYRADALLARLGAAYPEDVAIHFLHAKALRQLGRLEDADFHLGRAGEL